VSANKLIRIPAFNRADLTGFITPSSKDWEILSHTLNTKISKADYNVLKFIRQYTALNAESPSEHVVKKALRQEINLKNHKLLIHTKITTLAANTLCPLCLGSGLISKPLIHKLHLKTKE